MGQSQVKSHTGAIKRDLFSEPHRKCVYIGTPLFLSSLRRQLLLLVSMASYDTYLVWNIVVPALFAGVMWLLSFAVVLVYCFKNDKLPRIFMEMLQLSLSNIEEDSNCACVLVFGSRIRARALKLLTLLVVPLTLATIFFSFWNVWLVEEEARGPCLPHFDCFQIVDTKLNNTPVDSCPQSSQTVNGMETTAKYICYRFAFNYAEGIGAAGGILLFTAIFSKIYFALLVATFGKGGLCLTIGFVLMIAAAIGLILFTVLNAVYHNTVFQTDTDIVQFTLYALNFGAVVFGGVLISWGVVYA